jgi:hypothetical protein
MTASFFDIVIILNLAASTFPSTYSWVFDPILVSHSTLPKKTSDMVNTRKNYNGQGSNTNNQANPQIKHLIANQNQLMQAVLQTLQHLQPDPQQQQQHAPPPPP